jgi:hypothetical protein
MGHGPLHRGDETNDPVEQAGVLDQIKAYNQEDLDATEAVLEWLRNRPQPGKDARMAGPSPRPPGRADLASPVDLPHAARADRRDDLVGSEPGTGGKAHFDRAREDRIFSNVVTCPFTPPALTLRTIES